MHVQEFEFDFPLDLVATEAVEPRDAARLYVPWLAEGRHGHHFRDLPSLVRGDELFVLNNTRVIPCRLFGRRKSGGLVEIFLLRPVPKTTQWECLVSPSRRIRNGEALVLENAGDREVRVTRWGHDWQVDLSLPPTEAINFLHAKGHMPLPPYMRRADRPEDRKRYQTVFAERDGSCAAPTAGLHFTVPLLEQIRAKGCDFVNVTLHVGAGTFQPVTVENIHDHQMHSEWYSIGDKEMTRLDHAFREGREVACVGTTALRAVESAFEYGPEGETQVFFRPGSPPKRIRSLITNFHLPTSTLYMLVCSMAGTEATREMYQEIFRERYRLFSYGDGMWLRTLH